MEAESYGVAAGAGIAGVILVLEIALIVLVVIGMWKLFTKSGHPGWAAVIPVYNTCVMCDIGGKPMWWVLLMFIPVVNIVISILVIIGVAKNFGRSAGTVLGLIFLPFIFMMILGFGRAEYNKIEA